MPLRTFTFGLGPEPVVVISDIVADIKVDINQPEVTVEIEVVIN